MDNLVGLDWGDYFHRLSDDEIQELATWLANEFLEVWEFMDIVDRAYVQAPDEWRRQPPAFVSRYGRSMVERYAQRKRRFAELVASLEDARLRGALPGDVSPEELQPLHPRGIRHHSVEDLRSELEHARDGSP